VAEAERVADGDHEVADLLEVRVGDRDLDEVSRLHRWRGVFGTSKKRRKNGSFISGFCSCTVPRIAMFTTAGVTRFSIGASDGTGASPTCAGNWAEATDVHAPSRRAARPRGSFMRKS